MWPRAIPHTSCHRGDLERNGRRARRGGCRLGCKQPNRTNTQRAQRLADTTWIQTWRHLQQRCIQVWNVEHLPMSNVVTHSALTCKYFIKIIYNPFGHILRRRRMGWQPPVELSHGAKTLYRYEYRYLYLTETPEENGVNRGWEKKREEKGGRWGGGGEKAKIGFAADLMTEAR